MTDLLNLPYWNVLKVQETDLNYVIDATYEVEPAGCPHCGFMIRYGHGTKEKLFMDTPIHGKRVGIQLEDRPRHARTTMPRLADLETLTERRMTA